MELAKTIEQRKSVRTFDPERQVPDQYITELREFADSVETPFGGETTITLEKFPMKGDFKPGTYGVIKGAEWYFMVAIGDDHHSMLSAGYRFEQLVLKATELGLGTCWIAGTFKPKDFGKNLTFPTQQRLRVVSPLGYPADKKTFIERLSRSLIGSNNRKPFDSMFFMDNFNDHLSPDNKFRDALAMLRLAPSATNSQPWRALVDNDKVYFYYENKSKFSVIDLGIGLAHFELTLNNQGLKGHWTFPNEFPAHPKWHFVTLFTLRR